MSDSDLGGLKPYGTVERLLIDHGPLSAIELIEVVRESGVDLGTDAEEDLLTELYEVGDDFTRLANGRWGHIPTLVGGRMFTRRLTDLEIAHDVLTIVPDLVAIPALPVHSGLLRLTDRGALTVAYPGSREAEPDDDRPADAFDPLGSLLLPRGTLDDLGVGDGDLVGLRITARGIQLTRIDKDELQPHPEAVLQQWAEIVSSDQPTVLEAAVLSVCADVGEAFRAVHSPLTELLLDLGVARNGAWVASAGFDFAGYWADVRVTMIAEEYQLGRDEALAVAALSGLHERLTDLIDTVLDIRDAEGEGDDSQAAVESEIDRAIAEGAATRIASTEPTVGSMARSIARPEVASALLEEAVSRGESGAEALTLMAQSMEDQASRATRPALRWLRAKAYESLGRVGDAEADLHAAERLDPNWPLTLLDLARYASDRGDAPRGLALLARAAPYVNDDLEQLLRANQPEPGPTVGRNEPCWCGSGRKFKQCHLHKTAPKSLEDRAAWPYQKAARFVSDGPWYSAIESVARERAAYAEDDKDVAAAVADPLVGDAVLFEGGAFEDFVEQRGFLLPEDERLLAEQWLLVDRSVFDVTSVRRGEGFTARDLRTGDTFEVRDRLASRSLKPDLLVCARVVPTGKIMQVFGGIEPVPLRDRDALMALLDEGPEPDELVAFLTRRFAPPSLENTEGDPLVLRDVVLVPTNPDALSDALDQTYRALEDTDRPEWIFERPIDGFDRICATLRLIGSELHVSTNSDRRMDGALATIRQLDPAVAVTSDERQPITDTRKAARLARERPSAGSEARDGPIAPEDLTPEIQQALADHMRQYEEQWLDMAIPALHGLTPREAAEDPTRREDLVRLLASFGDDDSPMTMSPRRLRTALGLEPTT